MGFETTLFNYYRFLIRTYSASPPALKGFETKPVDYVTRVSDFPAPHRPL